MANINWDEVKVGNLDENQTGTVTVGEKEGLMIDAVKPERSFLLKALVIFFGIITTFILLVVMVLLLKSGDVDKSIEVLKIVFIAISPLLGTLIGYYFGRNSNK